MVSISKNALVFFMLVFASCSKKTSPSQEAANIPQGQNGSLLKDPVYPSLPKEKIDASKLQVTRIAVSDLQNGNVLEHSLSYQVIGGAAQYIEYKIVPCKDATATSPAIDCTVPPQTCTDKNVCYQNRDARLRARIPMLWPGTIGIFVQACVNSESSLTAQNCGPITSAQFAETHYSIQAANALYRKVELEDQLASQLLDMRNIMKKFDSDYKQCEAQIGAVKQMLDAKTALVRLVLEVPYEVITNQAKASVDAILSPSGGSYEDLASGMAKIKKDFGNALHGALTSLCVSIDASNGIDYHTATSNTAGSVTCAIFEMIPELFTMMFFSTLNFSQPFGKLSDVFTTISAGITGDRDALVPKNCTAEQNFNTRMQGVNTQITQTGNEIINLKKELQSLGLLAN